MGNNTCFITNKSLPAAKLVVGSSIRNQIKELILKDFPDFPDAQFIPTESLNAYRKKYLEAILSEEYGELNELEKEVISSIESNAFLSENILDENQEELTFGQKIADNVAEFGGSWTFIITFFLILISWILINGWVLSSQPFDPYPFILLNLILSCLAAIQAPIIMMSQNRQGQKDRSRSEHDYKVNLKAELEIRLLHEKIDHLIVHQNKRLLEIQEMQMDYLQELANKSIS